MLGNINSWLQQMQGFRLQSEPKHSIGDRFIFQGKEVIVSRTDRIQDEIIVKLSEIKRS